MSLLVLLLEFSTAAQPASPPAISFIPDQGVYPNSTSRPIAFVVGDAETPANLLILAGSSANTNLVPDSGIIFGGSGSNRSATITPASGQTGTVAITITVMDQHGGAASNSFLTRVETFTEIPPAFVTNSPGATARFLSWTDYDEDGDFDLLIAGALMQTNLTSPGFQTLVASNQGDGTFVLVDAGFTDITMTQADWSDYDRDGLLDLLALGRVPQTNNNWARVARIYRNNGNGTFSLAPVVLPGVVGAAAWGDFDRDGDPDILLTGFTNSSFGDIISRVYRNDGSNHFTRVESWLPGVADTSSSRWEDFDRDGFPDLRLEGSYYTNGNFITITQYYRYQGNDIFAFNPTVPPSGPPGVPGDFDNDGDFDVVRRAYETGWPSALIRVHRTEGTNYFAGIAAELPAIQSDRFAWGDYDNDGDLDFFAADEAYHIGSLRLFRNNNPVSNTPPDRPIGLNVTLTTSNRVILKWLAPPDAQTTNAASLSYDVSVGTISNGIDVVSPPADRTTGWRWLAGAGQAQTNWAVLEGLPPGVYYWAVQAVDTAFAGSQFSTQAVFTVTRPVISEIPDQWTAPGSTIGPIAFQVYDGQTPATNLVLTVTSQNTNLVPLANIILGGAGTNRTVLITPVAGQHGSNIISITVTDGDGFTATTFFTVTFERLAAVGNWTWQGDARVYPADFNNDGRMDFLWRGYSYNFAVYLNLGSWQFTPGYQGISANESTSQPAFADYDNDGDVDFARAESSYIYRNDSGTNFTAIAANLPTPTENISAWGDFNEDGRLDLFYSSYYQADLSRNNGDGTFSAQPLPVTAVYAGSAKWGDLDNDGDFDLCVAGYRSAPAKVFTQICRNDGAGNLSVVVSNILIGSGGSLDLGDYDQDGDLDLLICGRTNTASGLACRIYRNDGSMIFTQTVEIPITQFSSAHWGDFDNDGDLDILLCGALATTIYLNGGNDSFTNMPAGLPGGKTFSSAWADCDGDGDLDVLSQRLMLNTIPITNQPPQPPAGLSSSFISNRITLSWIAPTDDHTASSALTYDLRLGTNAGGAQVAAPHADFVTGKRTLAGDVPVSVAYRRTFAHLPDATYYWSVQAIDGAFVGSEFAPEASFTYYHPTISGPSNVVVSPTSPSPWISLTVGDTDSPADSLALTAFSSNANFLPATNIIFGGSGSNRTATLNFPPQAMGTSVVTIVVTDVTGLTATNAFRFETAYFTDTTLSLPAGSNQTVCFGDYDADGDFDLYFAGRVFRNNGNWNFTQVATLPAGQRTGVAWGDFDRDGDLDLVIAGAGPTRIYRNDGGDVFTDIGAVIPDAGSSAVAWGDYDNDGDLDLLFLADVGGGQGRIYRNDGGNSFVAVNVGIGALGSSDAAWGDFDKDGDLDLLVSGFRSSVYYTIIYRNDGGMFSDIGIPLGSTASSSVAWGDYDNDGYLDALTVGSVGSTYYAYVYRNDQNGSFTYVNIGLPGTSSGSADWVDMDNDGHLDIFLCGASAGLPISDYATRIYRNNQNGTFSNTLVALPKSVTGAWADLDSDGDLDLFLSGTGTVTNGFFRNVASVSNSPPTAPTGFVADLLPENGVLFSWLPASDLETTNPASLNYALRVGTVPNGNDLVSPDADAVTGLRRLPVRGRLSATTWLLHDLPRGTNYWSVQAVDQGWVGSPFAIESSFVITNGRPIISGISNQLTVPGRATPPINFTVWDFETPPADLVLAAYSTNLSLVPTNNIIFGGSGTNRTATVTPVTGLSGNTTISIVVADGGGLVATSRFDVVVQTFTEVSAGLPSTGAASAWGDYDNDGDLDIALAGLQYGNTAIYRNTNGFFTNQNFNLTAASYYLTPTDLAWIDFDTDGDLDLTESGWLTSGYVTAMLRFRNNFPTNSFTSVGTGLPGIGVTNIADGAMAWADYDNDGDLDVLLAGDTNTYHSPDAFTVLYRNDGGTFTNSGVVLPALVKGAAVWGDYDNDGDLDLLLAGQTGSIATNSLTKLFRNDGNNVFTEAATSFPGITDCALAFGDFDNDGDLDIAMAGMGANSIPLARIYRNVGNGIFTNINVNLLGVTFASLTWGDFNNDGFADLAVSGSTNTSPYNSAAATTSVYRNLAGGGFTNIGGTLPGVMLQKTSWGDADNDGDLDLLAGTRLVRNNWNTPNAPPTVPTNLTFTILTNNDVRLAWSPATDMETTNSRGLYYNLRLGTNSGGGQILSPLANVTNGYHRVPNFGNAGQTNFWRIANLTNGTYFWSVQAIDPGLAGSPFAVEASFTLSRPTISAITNRSTPPNTNVGPINFTVTDAETFASNLVVTVTSSDTNLVPATGLVLTGTDAARSLTITPATNRSGFVTITIAATDESGQTGYRSFLLTVQRFADIVAGLSVNGQMNWGDYDNDGDLDLAHGSTIYRNNGNGAFTNIAAGLLSSGVMTAAWGDYDNDDDLDLLIAGNGIRGLYRNDGNGVFTSVIPNGGGNANTSLAWGDYDNDGDQDFLFAYSNYTSPYRNDGSNVFTQINAGLPIVNVGSAAWGDYDEDGDLDILIAGNGLLRVYQNNGNGTFSNLIPGFPALYFASVAWGDFDNDGLLDFVAAGSTNNSVSGLVTRFYRNTGNTNPNLPVFTNLYPAAVQGIWKGAIAWGDYDNDGDLDLLVTGETFSLNAFPFTKIYRNDNGSFADSGYALPALKSSFAAWGDFNNDGLLDLALSGLASNNEPIAFIYRNYGSVTNTPPNAPGSLTNLVVGKSVRLGWTAAGDPNQTGGLSYNLRVGTSPGAGNIVSPMSHPNGFRKIPTLGNVNERLEWTITNLTGGTFYWSVQAVDHSFAGSAFATESSFIVSNRAPSAVTKSATTAEDIGTAVALSGSDPDNDPLTYRIAGQPLFGTLSGTPPNLTYKPATNYFGFDQFTYVANDRTTDSPPAAVFIRITPVDDGIGSTLGIQPGLAGGMQLSLLAEPWRSYRIEASEDLIHWVPLTNVLSTNLLMQLLDADAAIFPKRFYRAAQFVLVPGFGSAGLTADGQFQFILSGEMGRNCQVQISTNLQSWTTLTNVLMTNQFVPFTDIEGARIPQRFYRIVAF